MSGVRSSGGAVAWAPIRLPGELGADSPCHGARVCTRNNLRLVGGGHPVPYISCHNALNRVRLRPLPSRRDVGRRFVQFVSGLDQFFLCFGLVGLAGGTCVPERARPISHC